MEWKKCRIQIQNNLYAGRDIKLKTGLEIKIQSIKYDKVQNV